MGAKISKNQRVGATQPKAARRLDYGLPVCGFCGKKTRRTKPKWRVCEKGHKLYKLKG
jgi:hypothetical protein